METQVTQRAKLTQLRSAEQTLQIIFGSDNLAVKRLVELLAEYKDETYTPSEFATLCHGLINKLETEGHGDFLAMLTLGSLVAGLRDALLIQEGSSETFIAEVMRCM